jgi:hypothetical protein
MKTQAALAWARKSAIDLSLAEATVDSFLAANSMMRGDEWQPKGH